MERIKKWMALVIAGGATVALGALLFVTQIAPRMNWSAAAKPGALETRIADEVRERWIALHSRALKNPLAVTPENLASGRAEYGEHCAACHGFDGSGRNRLGADFYPPVPRLTSDTQEMSDAELFFVTANGVALSGMPAFGGRHSSDEIWKTVLWVRHLPDLTPDEREQIEREGSGEAGGHEE